MNWKAVMLVASFCFLFAGCDQKSLPLPDGNEPYAVVTHLKEPALAFLESGHKRPVRIEKIDEPWSQMVSIDSRRMVALAQTGTKLLAIDTNSGAVDELAQFDEALTAVTALPGRDAVAVADTENSEVKLVSVEHGDVMEAFALDGSPSELLADGSGLLFVLCADKSNVFVFDLETMEQVNSFPVSERPAGLFFDGELLWTGGHGPTGNLNSAIRGYEVASGEMKAEVEVGLMPIAITGSREENELYVVSHGDHHVYKVNRATQTVVAKAEVGQNPNYIYLFGNELLVSNFDSDTLSVLQKDPFELTDEVSVGTGPYAISVAPGREEDGS
ncbi:hypothetical protein CHH65_07390 [Shouchella clausii]|uniref:hypothetical protein n=1 Tax=Shouchella clausii TaxID=79880 RepID=UPI000BA6775B|nr:hypothetical protein [Shouchella clausii]PAF10154.1 hypothetical protein CHH65_07390 [Shouchella clausii]